MHAFGPPHLMPAQTIFWSADLSQTADIATIVGIVITVFALGVALYGLKVALHGRKVAVGQLQRTQDAVEAADASKEATRAESALRQVLILLPSMAQIANALDEAVTENSHRATERELANWCERGSELHGMLKKRADLPLGLASDLLKSITQATSAKSRLGDGEDDLRLVTKRARRSIATAVAGLNGLSGEFRAYLEKEEEEEEEEEDSE